MVRFVLFLHCGKKGKSRIWQEVMDQEVPRIGERVRLSRPMAPDDRLIEGRVTDVCRWPSSGGAKPVDPDATQVRVRVSTEEIAFLRAQNWGWRGDG